ncbi:MAG: phosphoribosylglycinamide formyltransferase 2, partial [Akkermansiaceae bacterium]|nr:phosphoribosylglycinamide formyltransferase 2 [Akkermansiaceae bacterium]
NLDQALAQPDTQLRLFGKPSVSGKRRMAVGLARGTDIDQAREKARNVIGAIEVKL